jgi:hypothetical protein
VRQCALDPGQLVLSERDAGELVTAGCSAGPDARGRKCCVAAALRSDAERVVEVLTLRWAVGHTSIVSRCRRNLTGVR